MPALEPCPPVRLDRLHARCRYCHELVVVADRVGDHEMGVLRRHLRRCRPSRMDEVRGTMSGARKHFAIDPE